MAKNKNKDFSDDDSQDEQADDFELIEKFELLSPDEDTTPSLPNFGLSKNPQYFDVSNAIALFPFISFKGDKRPVRIWKRTAINPVDGSFMEQKLEFIADASSKKTAQGKAAWLALLGIKYLWERRNRPQDGKVSFSMHELCRLFDIPYNGRRAKEFYEAFIALSRMTIESTNALTLIDPRTGKRNPVEKTVNSTFISSFGKIKTGELGREVERFFVQINPIYVQSLNTQDSSRVNLTMIANLTSSRSISLYVLLCSMYQNYRSDIIDYNLKNIAEDLPLNPNRSALSKVKEDLEPIMKELIRNELLKSYTYLSDVSETDISKRPKLSDVVVRFELGQRVVIAPAQIPNLAWTSNLMLTSGEGEDSVIGRLCRIGYSVNEANYLFKMYTKDLLQYALKAYESKSEKGPISAPTKYFKGILEKAKPEQYQQEAKVEQVKKAIKKMTKNINELYKEYYDNSRESVIKSEGIYWQELIENEVERLSYDPDFKEKPNKDKHRYVEYDLITSAPYNVMPFDAFKEAYAKGKEPLPYKPNPKK